MSALRVVTDSLGGSPLSRAMQEETLDESLVARRPRSSADWSAHASAVRNAVPGDWLSQLRGAFGSGGAAGERLDRVARAGGIVVTTGQQAGLFGGPIYVLSKAVGALTFANAIERATQIPAAPVFWAATDDADFAEASTTHIMVRGELESLALTGVPIAGTPMARTPLSDIQPLITRLQESCGSMPYDAAFKAVTAAYHAGATVGGAYVQLLRALLEPLGIAVLDSSHPEVRRASAPITRAALERADVVAQALETRRARLMADGYEPQVADVAGLSTVFVHEQHIKRRVLIREALAIAKTSPPESLSANVLLRPVVERAILPTVAYVAGPGELAYFTQVSAVAQALDRPSPLAIPRWSCTIVEPTVARALDRLEIGLDDLNNLTALERTVAQASVPGELRQAMVAFRATIRTALHDLHTHDRDALLAPATLDGAERSIGFRIERLERRLLAAAKRQGSDSLRDLHLVRTALVPKGRRQERTLNFIPFLARHGNALWEAMQAAASAHAAFVITGS